MKEVKITVIKKTVMEDLLKEYGGEGLGICKLHEEGQEYICNGWQKPEGLCDNAWKSMMEYVIALSHGGKDFYGGWLKDENMAVISCNDGLRPVIFRVEAIN
ncbi:MAG: TIGR04076 family protein [Defluviitaleaceae bacterium]|nr:TIGR04076 family protein [Defluviitaleaceae bacterium]